MFRRSSGGVSPVRLATVMSGARLAEPGGRERDPGERRPEVALDVVGQRLERADVEDADAARVRLRGRRPRRSAGEPVERPEERGEGLAAAGRGVDERVAAAR